jgi:hypothetical protein
MAFYGRIVTSIRASNCYLEEAPVDERSSVLVC